LSELTVDLKVFDQAFDQRFFRRNGLTAGVYFDQATYGRDAFVPASFLFNAPLMDFAPSKLSIEEALASMPLDEESRRQLAHLMTVRADNLPDIGFTEVESYLSSISYETFLTQHAEVSSETVRDLLRRTTTGYFGLGTDAAPTLDAMLFGLPGLNKTGIPGAQWLANQAIVLLVEPYIFLYPDGNTTVNRLPARSLIPEWSDQSTAEGMVKAILNYAQLDRPEHNVQIRLLSTAINVTNRSDGVDLIYRRHGRSHRARGKNAVLACYNMMIPHLCPELPAPQCAALSQFVKVPLEYTNVVLNNSHAIKAQQMGFADTPSSFHSHCMVDFPVSTPGYDFARTPDDPIVLHISEALIAPGLPPREQHRVGRARLPGTSFATIVRDVRQTLAGILGPAAFDPARDIAAITVNRWPHGCAYGYNPLFDPEYGPGKAPHEIGRQTFGNIAIAYSDAGARAYLDAAIDQGHRAVGELQGQVRSEVAPACGNPQNTFR
jgi:spermidine dehydrogenase